MQLSSILRILIIGLKNMEWVRKIDLPPLEKCVLLMIAWKVNDKGPAG
jgi:hypothetical protein